MTEQGRGDRPPRGPELVEIPKEELLHGFVASLDADELTKKLYEAASDSIKNTLKRWAIKDQGPLVSVFKSKLKDVGKQGKEIQTWLTQNFESMSDSQKQRVNRALQSERTLVEKIGALLKDMSKHVESLDKLNSFDIKASTLETEAWMILNEYKAIKKDVEASRQKKAVVPDQSTAPAQSEQPAAPSTTDTGQDDDYRLKKIRETINTTQKTEGEGEEEEEEDDDERTDPVVGTPKRTRPEEATTQPRIFTGKPSTSTEGPELVQIPEKELLADFVASLDGKALDEKLKEVAIDNFNKEYLQRREQNEPESLPSRLIPKLTKVGEEIGEIRTWITENDDLLIPCEKIKVSEELYFEKKCVEKTRLLLNEMMGRNEADMIDLSSFLASLEFHVKEAEYILDAYKEIKEDVERTRHIRFKDGRNAIKEGPEFTYIPLEKLLDGFVASLDADALTEKLNRVAIDDPAKEDLQRRKQNEPESLPSVLIPKLTKVGEEIGEIRTWITENFESMSDSQKKALSEELYFEKKCVEETRLLLNEMMGRNEADMIDLSSFLRRLKYQVEKAENILSRYKKIKKDGEQWEEKTRWWDRLDALTTATSGLVKKVKGFVGLGTPEKKPPRTPQPGDLPRTGPTGTEVDYKKLGEQRMQERQRRESSDGPPRSQTAWEMHDARIAAAKARAEAAATAAGKEGSSKTPGITTAAERRLAITHDKKGRPLSLRERVKLSKEISIEDDFRDNVRVEDGGAALVYKTKKIEFKELRIDQPIRRTNTASSSFGVIEDLVIAEGEVKILSDERNFSFLVKYGPIDKRSSFEANFYIDESTGESTLKLRTRNSEGRPTDLPNPENISVGSVVAALERWKKHLLEQYRLEKPVSEMRETDQRTREIYDPEAEHPYTQVSNITVETHYGNPTIERDVVLESREIRKPDGTLDKIPYPEPEERKKGRTVNKKELIETEQRFHRLTTKITCKVGPSEREETIVIVLSAPDEDTYADKGLDRTITFYRLSNETDIAADQALLAEIEEAKTRGMKGIQTDDPDADSIRSLLEIEGKMRLQAEKKTRRIDILKDGNVYTEIQKKKIRGKDLSPADLVNAAKKWLSTKEQEGKNEIVRRERERDQKALGDVLKTMAADIPRKILTYDGEEVNLRPNQNIRGSDIVVLPPQWPKKGDLKKPGKIKVTYTGENGDKYIVTVTITPKNKKATAGNAGEITWKTTDPTGANSRGTIGDPASIKEAFAKFSELNAVARAYFEKTETKSDTSDGDGTSHVGGETGTKGRTAREKQTSPETPEQIARDFQALIKAFDNKNLMQIGGVDVSLTEFKKGKFLLTYIASLGDEPHVCRIGASYRDEKNNYVDTYVELRIPNDPNEPSTLLVDNEPVRTGKEITLVDMAKIIKKWVDEQKGSDGQEIRVTDDDDYPDADADIDPDDEPTVQILRDARSGEGLPARSASDDDLLPPPPPPDTDTRAAHRETQPQTPEQIRTEFINLKDKYHYKDSIQIGNVTISMEGLKDGYFGFEQEKEVLPTGGPAHVYEIYASYRFQGGGFLTKEVKLRVPNDPNEPLTLLVDDKPVRTEKGITLDDMAKLIKEWVDEQKKDN